MENKINRQRLYLHALFVLLIFTNQSIFSAIYAKNYHFSWAKDFQPMLILFYLLVVSYTYFIAFVILNLKPLWVRFAGIMVAFLLFPPLRFLVDQRISDWLFGVTDYPKTQTFGFIFHDNLFFSFIVLLLGVFLKFMDDWFIHDRIKATLEKQNLRLELDFLKSQVNPHFLFNTLNNIQSFIVQNNKPKSIELIGRLSEFMRFALYECDEEYIDLDKEIDMLTDYVELERVRCDDRVSISFIATGDFDDLQIPPLLLMPFVENAFKHGADNQLDKSWINITITQNNNKLQLNVSNNFVADNSAEKAGGIGLQNVTKRLRHYFPGRYSLLAAAKGNIFEADLSITL
ncbi:histidine kinase [Mucilaginibacter gracilis]|uniref:Histidine kinase n=1 Tax=Mucilaginibacter gracilis TaxID=423350 RepID=A0A495IUI3_9SPHI|nr:histidine kinase [Mucilaginibacter gracilis]RKR80350.1 histidine kinase [Mucilaginibacter gracilis]